MKSHTRFLALLCAWLPALASAGPEENQTQLRASDILQYVPAVGAAAYTAYQRDSQGLWQLTGEVAVSMAATLALKEAFNNGDWGERPNGGSHSFPSGHMAKACTGAAYMTRRYGWESGLPADLISAYVGYIRVNEHQHHLRDVIAGCAVSFGAAYWLVKPALADRVSIAPYVEGSGLGLLISANW